MQVYRGMDIGTAKPTAQERAVIPHHLIDIADPGASYSVAEFQEAGHRVLAEISSRHARAIICGGSGLHFRALVDPMLFPPTDDDLRAEVTRLDPLDLVGELLEADPTAGEHTDLANPRRVQRAVEVYRLTGETPTARAASEAAGDVRQYRSSVPFIGLGMDPEGSLEARVTERLDAMLAAGWLEEVRELASVLGPTASLAVGYQELSEVVAGTRSLAEARALILQETLSLAKRQRTFFRRDPRIRWLRWHDDPGKRAAWAVAALEEAAWTS